MTARLWLPHEHETAEEVAALPAVSFRYTAAARTRQKIFVNAAGDDGMTDAELYEDTVWDGYAALERDSLLAAYLNVLEAFNASATVTLLVQGCLIRGETLSLTEYLDIQMAALAKSSVTVGPASGLSEDEARRAVLGIGTAAFQTVRDESEKFRQRRIEIHAEQHPEEMPDELRRATVISTLPRDFVMLKNVQIVSPDGGIVRARTWRCRLSEIGGWSTEGLDSETS